MWQKGSGQVGFIVKAAIRFKDSDLILSMIDFIIFPRTWIIRVFWGISALCNQFIGIMWRSHLINCLCQLINLLHLTFRVFMKLVTHRNKGPLQNFCRSNEHCFRLTGYWRELLLPLNSQYVPWLVWFLQTNVLLILGCCKDVLSIHCKSGEQDFLEFRRNSFTMLTQ